MFCRNCGKQVSAETVLCMECGARPKAGKSYCNNCGAATSELAEICVKCGAKLVDTPAASPPPVLPGVISVYRYGWKKLWPSFWILFLISLVYFALNSMTSLIPKNIRFLSILSLLYTPPLEYGVVNCYLRVAREGKVIFEDMFNGFKNYWNTIAAYFLSFLIILGGFILLVVPGIIFACKLAFVPYLVIDRKLGPVAAIKESWNMTEGHAMEVFLIGLVGIPIVIAGLICLIVGVIVSYMWIGMAMASLYYAVSEEKARQGAQTAAGV
jgi:uncharacterized membrane protein